MKFILGRKIGMTTIYEKDVAHNVTLVFSTGVKIVRLKTNEIDGYQAVVVQLLDGRTKSLVKREFRVDDVSKFKVGDVVSLEQFKSGDSVIVRGVAKSKGFQGVVKRHGFAGSPASHGHRHDLRAPGSIGSAFPERVMKGKKMAGRMGGQRVTVKNLEVVKIDQDDGLIAIKGAIPGNNGGVVEIVCN